MRLPFGWEIRKRKPSPLRGRRMQRPPDGWLNGRDVAARYGVRSSAVSNWISRGKIPPPEYHGGRPLWRAADLADWQPTPKQRRPRQG